MNWRAIINIVGPVFFGSLYTYGRSNNYPGLVFLVAGLTCVAAEGVLRTLPTELFVEKGTDATVKSE
jgi:hypothetical protein